MPPVPSLPASLKDDDLAAWLWSIFSEDVHPGTDNPWKDQVGWRRGSHERQARAVRALVEAKVREALEIDQNSSGDYIDEAVSRVMGGAS
jgi:hypothetical protein